MGTTFGHPFFEAVATGNNLHRRKGGFHLFCEGCHGSHHRPYLRMW